MKVIFAKALLKAKKFAPDIMLGVGVAGVIAGTIIAVKAAPKGEKVLEELNNDLDDIRSKSYSEVDNPEKAKKKDITKRYLECTKDLTKTYAPAMAVGVASLSLIFGSHHVMKNRNAALAAAYMALDKSHKTYRSRVVERFGENVDKQLEYGLHTEEIKEKEKDEETGKTKTIKKSIDVVDENGESLYSPHARFFDAANPNWEKNSEYNLSWLIMKQDEANKMLRKRGFMFLNDVYELLGFKPSQAGQIVGWFYDPVNPTGDNYIDFGIFQTNKYGEANADFVNGLEPVILLDFNIDGPILDLI